MKTQKSVLNRGSTLFAVVFNTPAVLMYTIFLIFPMFFTFYYALLRWNGITSPRFIGLGNFVHLFSENRHFFIVVLNTIKSMGCGLLIQLPIALILAYMVYRTVFGFNFFQSVYFIPVVISSAIIGLMFSLFFNSDFGPINKILEYMGLKSLQRIWLSDPKVVLFSVIFPGIWQYIGYHFVIMLAGMQGIPEDMIESARIDGANTIQIFFRMVIPNIKDILKVDIIICLTGSIKTFDVPYIMTQGGPGAYSSFLSVFMYKEAFINTNIGLGTAVALIMLVMALLATMVINNIFMFLNRND